MADETLKVKLELDTSDAKKAIRKVGLESTAITSKGFKKGLSGVSQDISKISNIVKSGLGGSFGTVATSVAGVKVATAGIPKEINKATSGVKNLGDTLSQSFDGVAESVKGVTSSLEQATSPLNLINSQIDDLKLELKGIASEAQAAQEVSFMSPSEMKEFGLNPEDYTDDKLEANLKSLRKEYEGTQKEITKLIRKRDLLVESQKRETKAIKTSTKAVKDDTKAKTANAEKTVKSTKKAGGGFKSLGSTIKKVAALAVAYIGVKLINSVADLGKEVQKMSQRLNLSTKGFQNWNFMMTLCGATAEDLTSLINPMLSKIREAGKGSIEAQDSFKKLGVSIQDENGQLRDTNDIFNDVVKGLQNVKNKTERSGLAIGIFGESADKLNGILNMSSKQMDYIFRVQNAIGGVMSDNLVDSAVQYKEATLLLQTATQGVKNALVQGLFPVLTKVVKTLALGVAYVGAFFSAFYKAGDKGKKPLDSLNKGINSYTNGVNGATEAVKELKLQTLGFDEMNILAGDDTAAGSISGGMGDIPTFDFGGDLGAPKLGLITEDELSKLEEFKVKAVSVANELKKTFSPLKDSLKELWGGTLQPLFIGVLGNLKNIGEAIITPETISGLASVVDEAGKLISSALSPVVEDTDAITANMSSDLIPSALGFISSALSTISGVISTISDVTKPLRDAVIQLVSPITSILSSLLQIGGTVVETIGDNLTTVFESLRPVIDAVSSIISDIAKDLQEFWDKHGDRITKAVQEAIKNIGEIFNNLWEFVEPVIKEVGTMIEDIWKELEPIFKDIIDIVGEIIEEVLDFWNDTLSPLINYLLEKFKPVFIEVFNHIKSTLKPIIKDVTDNIKNIVSTVKNVLSFVKNVFKGDWKAAWEDVKKVFKNIWDSIAGTVKTPINAISGIINSFLRGLYDAIKWIQTQLNKISFDVPDWVPGIGGKHFGIHIDTNWKEPQIPALATGGIVTASTIANIGEDGREAVLPLDKNTGWMDQLADKITKNTPTKISLIVDGKELGYAAINNINRITHQTGNLQLQLV